MLFYFSIYLLVINCFAFILYGIDKQKAKNNRWRISEKTLIMSAVIGGSIGAWLGMQFFRHKTKHMIFVVGVPVILAIQLILAGLLFYLFYIK